MKLTHVSARRFLAAAAVLAAIAPPAADLLHAQVIRCYIEVCVDKGDGQSCYEKPVECPEQVQPAP